jgi:hypothetical protein
MTPDLPDFLDSTDLVPKTPSKILIGKNQAINEEIKLKSNYNFTLNKLAEALMNDQDDIWENARENSLVDQQV